MTSTVQLISTAVFLPVDTHWLGISEDQGLVFVSTQQSKYLQDCGVCYINHSLRPSASSHAAAAAAL